MLANEEVSLLIKSRYPVVFLESIDEEYVINQLQTIALQLDLVFYQWSLTTGLQKLNADCPYYQSNEPVKMLRWITEFFKYDQNKPGLFVLKDFNKYLDDEISLRLFKDLINTIRNTKNTFVILAAEYKLPKDIEPDAVHIVGGYPSEEEITDIIHEVCDELRRSSRFVRILLSNDEISLVANTLKGLSVQQIRNILNQCMIEDNVLDIKDLQAIEKYKKQIFDQEGLLEFCISEDKGNLANFDSLKRWLSERRSSFSQNANPALPTPKGILLMGVQGCGKSLAIKVIARELNMPIYRLDIGKLYSKYIGETEENLRKALSIAEKISPLCLWLDEIEKGFASSGSDVDGGVSQRILGSFLTWMQERKSPCFLAATANDVYRLPPEFLRKGRFDEIFFIDLPDELTRETLFRIHLSKRGLKPGDFDCKLLAEKAQDFSGAEIEQAIISALYTASDGKEQITTEGIIDQIGLTKPLAVIKAEEISALRDWAKERTIPA